MYVYILTGLDVDLSSFKFNFNSANIAAYNSRFPRNSNNIDVKKLKRKSLFTVFKFQHKYL